MEELKIICPTCKDRLILDDGCSNCEYTALEDQFLINNLLSSYNLSLDLISQKRIQDAWEELQRHLYQYPFIFNYLNLAFYLSLMNGAYDVSSIMLKKLKAVITDQDYQEYLQLLNTNVNIYNDIINGKFDFEEIDHIDLSLHHLYVLYLQKKREKQTHILNIINKIDPHFAAKLTTGKILPSFRVLTLYKIAFATIIGIAGIIYNVYEYRERHVLIEERKVLIDNLHDINERKDSLYTIMDIQEDSLNLIISHNKDSLSYLFTRLELINKENSQKNIDILRLENSKKDMEAISKIKEERIENLHEKIEEKDSVYLKEINQYHINLNSILERLGKEQIISEELIDKLKNEQELLKNSTAERRKVQKEYDVVKEKYETMEIFLANIKNNDFLQIANFLSEKENVEITSEQLGSDYIENVCYELYKLEEYSKILNIKFQCNYSDDSYYILYLSDNSKINRIRKIKEFISSFPENETYTAPLLNEAVKYYIEKLKEKNGELRKDYIDNSNFHQACEYFNELKTHVFLYPDHNMYITTDFLRDLQECN